MAVKTKGQQLKQPEYLQLKLRKILDIIVLHKSKVYILLIFHAIGLLFAAGWYVYKITYEKSAQEAYQQVESRSKDTASGSLNSIDGFKKVAANYPKSNAGLQSYYRMGNIYYNANQIDLSLQAYNHFIENAPKETYLLSLAFMGKGYCLEEKKDFRSALISFENALKSRHANLLQPMIYRDIGRVYEEMKDIKQSLSYYRKSLELTTDPVMEAMIKRKISSIN